MSGIIKDSIKDFNRNMTIFYSPTTGKIAHIIDGNQDMRYFAEDRNDFNYEFLILSRDDYVKNNQDKFIIQEGKLMLKPDPRLSKYEVLK